MNVGNVAQWYEDDDIGVLAEDQFHFTEIVVDRVPASVQDCATIMRPFIEQLANMAGRPNSSSFGQNGEYLRVFR